MKLAACRLVPALLSFAACAGGVDGAAPAPKAPVAAIGDAAAAAATARLEQLRAEVAAHPSGAALYGLAAYEARLGHPDDALAALRRLEASGWDGGVVDEDFPSLAKLPAYREIAARLAAHRPVAHASVAGFTVAERGLHAEGTAFDPVRAVFYVGSTTMGRIVAVDASGGPVRDVARTGMRMVLGLKVGGPDRLLWAACLDDEHPDGETCLLALDAATGATKRRACVPGPGHELNDLAVAADGTVYATDSATGAVVRLPPGSERLEPLVAAGVLRGSNGIALASDDRVLLVAHGRGIARIVPSSGARTEVEHPDGASFVGIDGMSLRGQTLFAIANVYGPPRVSRIELDAAFERVVRSEVVESGTPAWDEPTTGALGPDGFYYVADSQMSSGAAPRETVILKVPY